MHSEFWEFWEFNCLHLAKEERGRQDLENVGKFNQTPYHLLLSNCLLVSGDTLLAKGLLQGQGWVLVWEIWIFGKNQQCFPSLEKNVMDFPKVVTAVWIQWPYWVPFKPMTLKDGTEPPRSWGFLSGTFCALSHAWMVLGQRCLAQVRKIRFSLPEPETWAERCGQRCLCNQNYLSGSSRDSQGKTAQFLFFSNPNCLATLMIFVSFPNIFKEVSQSFFLCLQLKEP